MTIFARPVVGLYSVIGAAQQHHGQYLKPLILSEFLKTYELSWVLWTVCIATVSFPVTLNAEPKTSTLNGIC